MDNLEEKTRDGVIYETFCKIKEYTRTHCFPIGEKLTIDIFTQYVEFLVDEEKKSF